MHVLTHAGRTQLNALTDAFQRQNHLSQVRTPCACKFHPSLAWFRCDVSWD